MKLPAEIRSFSKEGGWSFLSNFYPCRVTLDDEIYDSVEHAYQAAKTLSFKEREKFRYAGVKASDAKREWAIPSTRAESVVATGNRST